MTHVMTHIMNFFQRNQFETVVLFILFNLFGLNTAVQAQSYTAGHVRIERPFAAPTVPGAPNGVAYITTLESKQADRLLRTSTPVAASNELHNMTLDAGGVMRMRELSDLQLTPGSLIKMQPGQGVHIMLMGLKKPLKLGDTFPMTLEFERGGKVVVNVVVQVGKNAHSSGESPPH
jgi:periplasmic copper chaperone A